MRAAIDWSYELLGNTEQLLLDRLSIFAGGFTLEAAEAVSAGGLLETEDVFELLATLVARSLVVADTEGIDTRYRLLETIRQYAQEHLDSSGDGDRLRAAHAAYYTDFAEEAIARVVGPEGIEWELRLRREYDNLRTALTWATETADFDIAVRLLGMWDALFMLFLTDAGMLATVTWSVDAVLALPGASEHPRYPAALTTAAAVAFTHGDPDLARRRCEDALAAEQRLGTDPSNAVWVARGAVSLALGQPAAAIEYSRRAATLARARDEPAWLAIALAQSAAGHSLSGDPNGALADAEEAIALIHALSNRRILQFPLSVAAFAAR